MDANQQQPDKLPSAVVATIVYVIVNFVLVFLIGLTAGPGTGVDSVDACLFLSWFVAPAFALFGTDIAIMRTEA